MPSFTATTTFNALRCCQCGVEFALLEYFQNERRRDGKTFYCPNGHAQTYGDTEADQLRRERDRLKQEQARLHGEIADRDRWLTKEVTAREKAEKETKRIKKRAAAGVCPCCTRHFTQLERHMQAEHPEIATIHVASDVHAKINKRASK